MHVIGVEEATCKALEVGIGADVFGGSVRHDQCVNVCCWYVDDTLNRWTDVVWGMFTVMMSKTESWKRDVRWTNVDGRVMQSFLIRQQRETKLNRHMITWSYRIMKVSLVQ